MRAHADDGRRGVQRRPPVADRIGGDADGDREYVEGRDEQQDLLDRHRVIALRNFFKTKMSEFPHQRPTDRIQPIQIHTNEHNAAEGLAEPEGQHAQTGHAREAAERRDLVVFHLAFYFIVSSQTPARARRRPASRPNTPN